MPNIFLQLKPQQRIFSGEPVTQNICVYSTHQNVKLKLGALKLNVSHCEKWASFESTHRSIPLKHASRSWASHDTDDRMLPRAEQRGAADCGQPSVFPSPPRKKFPSASDAALSVSCAERRLRRTRNERASRACIVAYRYLQHVARSWESHNGIFWKKFLWQLNFI